MIDSSEAGSPASDEKRIRKKGLEIEVRKEKSKKKIRQPAQLQRPYPPDLEKRQTACDIQARRHVGVV